MPANDAAGVLCRDHEPSWRWGGPGRLAGVGVRQETMANGSLMVLATADPPVLDSDVKACGLCSRQSRSLRWRGALDRA